MLTRTQFEQKAQIILPINSRNDIEIITRNGSNFSLNGRYRFNKNVYEIVTDFEEYKRLEKAVYIPPIPKLQTGAVAGDIITILSRDPIINNMIKMLLPEIEFYDDVKLNIKCNTFVAYSDSTPDIFAVDYLFNCKTQRCDNFIFYDFYPYLSDAKSIIDVVDIFNGSYEKTQVNIYPNYNIDMYTIDMTSFNAVKWAKYLYWISSSTGCTTFMKNKLFNISNYPKYITVKDFFDIEIFKDIV